MGNKPKLKLWTKDFTIITVGSIISMLGSSLSGFAMSLLVLDYTGSTFLFALYNVIYMVPYLIVPVLCGPFLDRFSRKKTIYTLDFITAGFYVLFICTIKFGLFNFGVLAVGCFILGTIGSIYTVAYDSFYPMLITEGNYSKAYSVASTLETLTMVMVPISAFIYNRTGIIPLFICDAVSYLIAAIMETQITADEKYIALRKIEQNVNKNPLGQFATDFKEGLSYLFNEKGLLAVTIYFTFSAFAGGVSNSVTLPYFKDTFKNGEYIYTLVWGMSSVGRAIGGGIHYKLKLPQDKKYSIAFTVYILLAVLEGTYLFTNIPIMMVMCFAVGILGVTSYNIRIAATQRYVPDERKGRFNGTFNTLNSAGSLIGQLIAGAAAEFLPIRAIIGGSNLLILFAAVIFIGGYRNHVAKIYNSED